MERVKNVYEITADLSDGNTQKIKVFSHSTDNAAKKAKMYFLRKKHADIDKIIVVKTLYENVIY